MRLLRAAAEGWTSLLPFDLEFEDGVYAVTGNNGAGKSTLLALLGPIPLLLEEPSKKPNKLPKYCVPGSKSDLIFEMGEKTFKASVRVNASGTTPLLYKPDGEKWEKIEGATGKIKPYELLIEGLIGPKESYYASVYGGDEGGFDTLDAPARRDLFAYYLGLKPLSSKYEKIKKLASDLPSRDDVDALRKKIEGREGKSRELQAEIEKYVRLNFKQRGKVDLASAALDAAKDVLRSYDGAMEKRDRVRKLEGEMVDLAEEIIELEATKPTLPPAPKKIDVDVEELDRRAEALDSTIMELEGAERERDEALRLVKSIEDKIEARSSDVSLSSALCFTDPKIETASCPFVQSAVKSEKIREKLAKQLVEAKAKVTELSYADAIEEALKEFSEVSQAKKDYETAKAREAARASAIAEIANADKWIEAREAKIEKLRLEVEALKETVASDDDIEAAECAVAEAAANLKEAKRLAAETSQKEAAAAATLELHAVALEEMREDYAALLDKLKDADAIEALRRACGPSGIPIYSIAAAGPDVSSKINDLLSACFDDRFEVFIRTERKKNDGGYTDVFDLIVFDSDRGEDVEFGTLAKGERAIISEAMRIALAIYQAERLDIPIRVLYRDEPASNLSAENNLRYVRMLRKAKEIGNFHQVFFATHDAKAAQLADFNISISGGKITVEAQ